MLATAPRAGLLEMIEHRIQLVVSRMVDSVLRLITEALSHWRRSRCAYSRL